MKLDLTALNPRAVEALAGEGILTVADLQGLDMARITELNGIGPKAVDIIKSLRGDVSTTPQSTGHKTTEQTPADPPAFTDCDTCGGFYEAGGDCAKCGPKTKPEPITASDVAERTSEPPFDLSSIIAQEVANALKKVKEDSLNQLITGVESVAEPQPQEDTSDLYDKDGNPTRKRLEQIAAEEARLDAIQAERDKENTFTVVVKKARVANWIRAWEENTPEEVINWCLMQEYQRTKPITGATTKENPLG